MKFKKLSESFSKYMRCPHCTNMTLIPVDGYEDLFICDDCGEELRAIPQFDGSYKFKPYNENDELYESENKDETWLGFTIECEISTDLDSDVFDLNWESNSDYFEGLRDDAIEKITQAIDSVSGCRGASMDDWNYEKNSNWGSIDYTFDGNFMCSRETCDLKALQAEIDSALGKIESHTTTEILYDGSYTTNYVPYGEQMVPEGDYLDDVKMKVHYDYNTSCTDVYRIGEDGYPIKESANNPEFVICVFDGDDHRWKMWGGTHTSPEDFNKEEFLARVNNQEFPNFTVINNYTDAKIIPNNGTEYRKLTESNELVNRAKKHKKKQKGLAITSLNPNAGNVELNNKIFNNMMNPAESPNTNPVSGPFGGDVGAADASGCCESATLEFKPVNNPEFIEMNHDDLFNKVLHKYIRVVNKDTGASLDILVDSVDVSGAGVCGHPVQPKDACKASRFDYYPKEYIVGWASAPISKLNESDDKGEERFAFFFPHCGGAKIMNRERALKQLRFELDNFTNDSGASLAGRGFAIYCLESLDDDGTSWVGRYDTKQFLQVLNESVLTESVSVSSEQFPYMFFYNCNNPTFGYDFQLLAKELGARKVYGNYKGLGSGSYFYLVPSEQVYNKLKDVAKTKYNVDMQRLLPFDSSEYPKIQFMNEEKVIEGILHDMPDGRYQAIRFNWSHEEVTLTCYDKEADEEFDKWICAGVHDEDTGRRTALKLFKDPAFDIPQEIKNELISTYGLDDFGYKIEESINSSEPAWDEIKAMRQEQAEQEARRAARRARFALYHKLFDDKVAQDENASWIDRVHTMFDEATEIQVLDDPSKVPSSVDGQKVSYKFSVEEIDIFADAYRDYLYIVTTK